MTEHCGTCCYYEASDPNEWGHPFGTCERLPETGQMSAERREWERNQPDPDDPHGWLNTPAWLALARPEDLAFTSDASSYCSTLHVRAEFGCVLHEPTEETK